jgi:hypothetical protein
LPRKDPFVATIGGKVFGLSDAPFFSRSVLPFSNSRIEDIAFIVPTELLTASHRIGIGRLLWDPLAPM